MKLKHSKGSYHSHAASDDHQERKAEHEKGYKSHPLVNFEEKAALFHRDHLEEVVRFQIQMKIVLFICEIQFI